MNKEIYRRARDLRVGDPLARAVLLALAYHSNKDGECGMRVANIVWHTELSERTVFRKLKDLKDAGLISTREGKRGIVYRVLPPAEAGAKEVA